MVAGVEMGVVATSTDTLLGQVFPFDMTIPAPSFVDWRMWRP